MQILLHTLYPAVLLYPCPRNHSGHVIILYSQSECTFESDLLKYFDTDFSDQCFTETNLFRSVQQSVITPISTLHGLRNYVRVFVCIEGWLKNKERISEKEYNHYFWSGLPYGLRSDITNCLLLKDLNLDVSIPYDAEDVIKAAEELLC